MFLLLFLKHFPFFQQHFFMQLRSTCFGLGVVDFAVCVVGVAEGIVVVVWLKN
jgi:hypothetical protein